MTDLFLPESSHEAHCHSSQLGGAGQHVESLQHHGDTELEQESTWCVMVVKINQNKISENPHRPAYEPEPHLQIQPFI